MADEPKDSQQPEKPAEPPKAAVPKPPPPPPGAKPAVPAAPPKPKGPQQEPWTSPLVDAIKEKFGGEFLKSYSFLGQNQIELKKDRIAEIMTFLRDNDLLRSTISSMRPPFIGRRRKNSKSFTSFIRSRRTSVFA